MALLSDGSPVVAWQDGPSPSQVYTVVLKPDVCGGAWQAMGAPVSGTSPALLVPAGSNQVFRASISMSGLIVVERWNGTLFEALGTTPNPLIAPLASPVMAADSSGNPILAWVDGNFEGYGYVRVARWDGSAWQLLTFAPGVLSLQADSLVHGLSLAITPAGVPVVAFTSWQSNATIVAEFVSGTTWTMLGTIPPPATGLGSTREPVLRINGAGELFLASTTYDANSVYRLSVARFDGSTWQPLGGQVNSVGQAESADMTVDNSGAPIVVDSEVVASETAARLYAYRWDGTAWQAFAPGLAGPEPRAIAADPAIAVDGSGRLVVSWLDLTDSASSYTAAVARYRP
jgi:hypothetical protein